MSFNTGNALPSISEEDLYDNMANLDKAMNSTEPTWRDRFNVEKPTIDAALKSAGFMPAGFDFVTGGTLQPGDRNKAVYNPAPNGDNNWYRWNGAFPKEITANSQPNPKNENNWVLAHFRIGTVEKEALRRTYQEAGYNLVDGSFEAGGTLVNTNDVLLYEAEGEAYSYLGVIPTGGHPVAPGTNPVGDANWAPRTDESLRTQLSQVGGANLVRYTTTKTVNAALISLDTFAAEAALDILALENNVSGLQGDVTDLQDQFFISQSNSPSVYSKQISSSWMNGIRGTVVLGDSISHGAFAGNLYSNGIMRLLARALNGKHNSSSYGFIPISAMGVGQPYETRDIQSSTITGFSARQTDLGAGYLPGIAYRSVVTGSKITMVIPSFQRRCIVHHANQVGGGSFTIKVNGIVSDTVDTSINSNQSAATIVTANDDGFGLSTIEVETTNSYPVDIVGFSYVSATGEHVLQNMSQSGRRARWLSTDVIDTACKDSNTLVFALGYNDSGETDQSYISAVTAHIDTVIAKANQYGTEVIVPDFIWTAGPSNWMRVQLKRLAEETGGIYIPFAEYLKKPNGDYADSSYLVSTLKMWIDGAHPNADGCAWIFSVIAKAMRLPCVSKRQALEQFDWWMSLRLNVTGIKNISATSPSSVRRTPSGLALRFFIADVSGSVIPQGTYDITTSYPPGTDISGALGNVVPLMEDSLGGFIGSIRVTASGATRVRITTTPTVVNLPVVIVA